MKKAVAAMFSEPSEGKLSLAVPNGSLQKQVVGLLCWLDIFPRNPPREPRQFRVAVDHPLVGEVVFMRPQSMTFEVARAQYDVAICGLDLYEEYSQSFERYRNELDDAWCVKLGNFTGPRAERKPTKIILFGHKDDSAKDSWDVSSRYGMISEYPNLTRRWFENLRRPDNQCLRHSGVSAIRKSEGTTEAHVPRDYRYGVCLTESGTTLAANNLKVLDVILETHPVLLAPSREKRNMPEWKKRATDELVEILVQSELLQKDAS